MARGALSSSFGRPHAADRAPCPRRRLPRRRLPGLAEPARRPHGAGPARSRARRRLRRARANVALPLSTVCAGRTDAGVHALNQVVHFDTPVAARAVLLGARHQPLPARRHRGAVVQPVAADFHARDSARGRRYRYVLLRVAGAAGARSTARCGWVFRPLDGEAMREAAAHLLGEHDFSVVPRRRVPGAVAGEDAARASRSRRRGAYWRFDFEANAFLHHMVRNIMGCLRRRRAGRCSRRVDGRGAAPRASRDAAAPTFAARRAVLRRAVLRCAAWRFPNTRRAIDWLP